ncbi:AlpA family phage regulatory protein (plasmid) [Ensifer adhaerens]|nr:AlpA family phage regulatory protein [Ensifer adhaerens]
MKDVCALTSLSRTMVNRLRSKGRFPEAVELGERLVAFARSEVLAWIEERIAGMPTPCAFTSMDPKATGQKRGDKRLDRHTHCATYWRASRGKGMLFRRCDCFWV